MLDHVLELAPKESPAPTSRRVSDSLCGSERPISTYSRITMVIIETKLMDPMVMLIC